MLKIHVQPNARHNRIETEKKGGLRLKLTAQPVKGAANKACVRFLAAFFDVPKSRIEIIRGEQSREKWIGFKAVDPHILEEALASKIAPSS
ncbi:MAG: DUF167 domain-containing protein [Nitrospiria bacterium]